MGSGSESPKLGIIHDAVSELPDGSGCPTEDALCGLARELILLPTETLSERELAEHDLVRPQDDIALAVTPRAYEDGLSLIHVTKRFESVQALADVSFSVERGRMLGFLGPNGAGKTTAMRAVFGLVQIDGGEVLWCGRPVRLQERLRFGYMPEERGMYPRMPVQEQLEYFGQLARARRKHSAGGCKDMARAPRARGAWQGEGGGALAWQPTARPACGGASA